VAERNQVTGWIRPIAAKIQTISSLIRLPQRKLKTRYERASSLFRIWGIAASLAFLLIVIAYNLFFGHAQVVRNEMIYQNHFYVGRAGTIELYRDEGYGQCRRHPAEHAKHSCRGIARKFTGKPGKAGQWFCHGECDQI
jgi:hypothetical protein